MSARDSLDMALSRGVHLMPSVRQSLINAYAHELAEETRKPLTNEESMLIQAHVPLAEILAARIDPKVEK